MCNTGTGTPGRNGGKECGTMHLRYGSMGCKGCKVERQRDSNGCKGSKGCRVQRQADRYGCKGSKAQRQTDRYGCKGCKGYEVQRHIKKVWLQKYRDRDR